MSLHTPIFSIITASYNSLHNLRYLTASIAKQKFINFEWIVVDGGSSDGTSDYLLTVDMPQLRWKSEPDGGIYEAMNKGVQNAKGQYFLFMGADDELINENVLKEVYKFIINYSAAPSAILCSALINTKKPFIFKSGIGIKTLIVNTAHHQATFYHADLFKEFRYNEKIKVVSDYELNLKILLESKDFAYLDIVVSKCGAQGISNTTNENDGYRDMHHIRKKYINSFASYCFNAIALLNVFWRRLLKSRR